MSSAATKKRVVESTDPKQAFDFTLLGPDGKSVKKGHVAVLDNITGLMWDVRVLRGDNWQHAYDQAKAVDLLGYSDWRMSEVWEQLSIVDYSFFNPAVDPKVFPKTPGDWHWTATKYPPVSGSRRGVDFNDGLSDWSYAYSYGFVRAVRSARGQ